MSDKKDTKHYTLTVHKDVLARFGLDEEQLDLLLLETYRETFPELVSFRLRGDARKKRVNEVSESNPATRYAVIGYEYNEEAEIVYALQGRKFNVQEIKAKMVQYKLRKEADQVPYNIGKYEDLFKL